MAKRKTQEQFIEQAISLNGNRYDYSQVEYTNNTVPVTITCREHFYDYRHKPVNRFYGWAECFSGIDEPKIVEYIKSSLK